MAATTYIERATAIVSNILGKSATQEQVIKAVDSVVAVNLIGLNYPDTAAIEEPEDRAQFFVESCKQFVSVQIERHADRVALEENQAAVDASKEDYIGDFNSDEPVPTTTKRKRK